MILTTYDKDLYEKTLKEDAKEEGREEGLTKGRAETRAELNQLTICLLNAKRYNDPEQCRKILTDLEKSAAPQQAAQPAIPGDAENGGATTGEQDIGTGDAPTTTSSAEAASGTEIQTNSADTASPPAIPVQQPAATPMEE